MLKRVYQTLGLLPEYLYHVWHATFTNCRYTLVSQLFQEVYASETRASNHRPHRAKISTNGLQNKQLTKRKRQRKGKRERERIRIEMVERRWLEELCAVKMLRIIYQLSLGGVKASAYSLGSDSRVFSSRQYNTCARPVNYANQLPFRVYHYTRKMRLTRNGRPPSFHVSS